ncbi:MAG: O-antigen translocase [Herbaspirillum sp.]
MNSRNSYHQILRSSSIIGGASVVNILVGLLRIKVAALLLGPAGVGLIGLLQNLMTAASTVAAFGFGNVGTRQIANAIGQDDIAGIAASRRALFWGTSILAVLGALIFWLLRHPLTDHIIGNTPIAGGIGWLAIGVAASVAASSQGALLTGLRRIGDIARISIWSALFSTAAGISALWLWRSDGLVAFVLAAPIANFIVSHLYVARLPKVSAPPTPAKALIGQWRELARLGTAFMVSGVLVTLGLLAVRSMVQHKLGAAALGQFEAAWTISMTYIGFVLSAMATDYYPRLTAAIHDHASVNRMVNEQTEVALLLAGPILLAMLTLAPWVIQLLFSSKFGEAAGVLRWQVLGDVLKVASWPLGFILLASGDGRTFMITEAVSIGIFAALVWLGLPLLGIKAAGLAFLGMYIVYLPMIHWIAQRKTGFKWTGHITTHLLRLTIAMLMISLLGNWSAWYALGVGLPTTLLFGIYGLARIIHIVEAGGAVGRLGYASETLLKKMGMRRG